MIEYLKRGWGIDSFMIKTKRAIERALIFCNLAFMGLMLLMYMSPRDTHNFSEPAEKIFQYLSILKKLTVGKLREVVYLDFFIIYLNGLFCFNPLKIIVFPCIRERGDSLIFWKVEQFTS